MLRQLLSIRQHLKLVVPKDRQQKMINFVLFWPLDIYTATVVAKCRMLLYVCPNCFNVSKHDFHNND